MAGRLTRGQMFAGLAGLGLLRGHRGEEPGQVVTIIDELTTILQRIDSPPLNEDALGELLDPEDGYGRWASVYDSPGNWVVEQEQPVVWGLLDALSGSPVLDAACGTGRHLAHLATLGRATIGVDLSEAMLAQAAAKVTDADLRQGDLLDLPLEVASVAGVVCALALEHVNDLEKSYAEFARVVAPGGWIVISTIHPIIRNVLGWGASFVDEGDGHGEVLTRSWSVSDHLNAAGRAGLRLVACAEPVMAPSTAARIVASSAAPVGGAAALCGIPIAFVCQFQRTRQNQASHPWQSPTGVLG